MGTQHLRCRLLRYCRERIPRHVSIGRTAACIRVKVAILVGALWLGVICLLSRLKGANRGRRHIPNETILPVPPCPIRHLLHRIPMWLTHGISTRNPMRLSVSLSLAISTRCGRVPVIWRTVDGPGFRCGPSAPREVAEPKEGKDKE
jgi:hypothetical protein